MQKPKLKSRVRVGAGKEGAKRLRTQGEIPAILYGHKREPVSLAVSQKEIWHILHTATSEHMILSLDVEGSKEDSILTLVRDIQHHPVSGDVLHLDLQRISADEKLHIGVPIELAGVSKGVKEEGGVLDHGIREVTLNVKPMEIPEKVSIDISLLEIGQSVHVSDLIALYPDFEIVDDPHVTIAHVSAPKKGQGEGEGKGQGEGQGKGHGEGEEREIVILHGGDLDRMRSRESRSAIPCNAT